MKKILAVFVFAISCMQLSTIEDSAGSSIRLEMQPKHGAAGISFYDAVLICNEMSKEEGLDTLYEYSESKANDSYNSFWLENLKVLENRSGYRLPTQEEWEQAYANNEFDDFEPDAPEWVYRNINGEYGYSFLAPNFKDRVIGMNRDSANGMRALKVILPN